jgi:replicative DNA helicase
LIENILNLIRNPELEKVILSCLLKDKDLWFQALEDNISEEHFYNSSHQELFKVMKELNKNNEAIDIMTVGNYLVKNNLTQLVSISYLSEILNTSLSTIGFKSYLKELKHYKEKRDIKDLMQFIDSNLDKDNETLKNDIMKRVLNLTSVGARDTGDIKEGIKNTLDDLELRISKTDKDKVKGLITGLKSLDLTLDGFEKKDLITIVARSGIGKTTLATSIMLNMLRNKYKVAIFSMEMPQDQIIKMLALNYCNIDAGRYKTGELSNEEITKFIRFTNWLEENNNLFIYNESNFNNIVSKIKRQHLKTGLDIVFIDYLNKIQGVKGGNRDIELNIITSTLKDIALQENLCIAALTQANRQVDKQQDKRLTLADIKESSSIEQNSDKIIALNRDKRLDNQTYISELNKNGKLNYNSVYFEYNPECLELEILKNRRGECKTIACRWYGKYARVKNW